MAQLLFFRMVYTVAMMRTITAIETQKGRKRRVNLYLDGEFTLGLAWEVAQEAGLHVGDSLSEAQVAELSRADLLHRAHEAALRFLSYRPRSRAEVRQRLRRGRLPDDVIEEALASLQAQGLLDDAEFARFWRGSREAFSPRSARLLRAELRQKGVDGETVAAATADLDEEGSAYRAGAKRARRMGGLEYDEFQRRLGQFLRRRGFSYELAHRVVRRLWRLWDEAQADPLP